MEVQGAKSDRGTIDGGLHSAETTWLKEPAHADRQPASPKAILVYHDLQPGTYALALFHDENGNGKLDQNVAGVPVERYGFSRDARGRMGPPAFADAAIELSGDMTITVNLR